MSSATRWGTTVLGRWPVGDVFTGERVLVHLGPHVAGVDGVHPKVRLLGGEDPADLVEGGLGGAVRAPPRVALDGGVGADVEDRSSGGTKLRQQRPDQLHGSVQVGAEDRSEDLGGQVGDGRLRAGPQGAGVVDQQPGAPELGGASGQRGAMAGIGDVAGDRVCQGQARDGIVQPGGVAGVQDQGPAASVQLAGQRKPQPLRGAGDHGDLGVGVLVVRHARSLQLQVDLKSTRHCDRAGCDVSGSW